MFAHFNKISNIMSALQNEINKRTKLSDITIVINDKADARGITDLTTC